MAELAKMAPLEAWQVRIDLDREAKRIDDPRVRKKILATLRKAEKDLQNDDNFPRIAAVKGGLFASWIVRR